MTDNAWGGTHGVFLRHKAKFPFLSAAKRKRDSGTDDCHAHAPLCCRPIRSPEAKLGSKIFVVGCDHV